MSNLDIELFVERAMLASKDRDSADWRSLMKDMMAAGQAIGVLASHKPWVGHWPVAVLQTWKGWRGNRTCRIRSSSGSGKAKIAYSSSLPIPIQLSSPATVNIFGAVGVTTALSVATGRLAFERLATDARTRAVGCRSCGPRRRAGALTGTANVGAI